MSRSHQENPRYLLKRVQIVSAVLFTPFLLIHLLNTALAVFGPSVYDNFQQTAQAFYQHPVIEISLVLLPLFAHALSGLWLLILNRKSGPKPAMRSRLHRVAGIFLLLFVFGHVIATRGLPYLHDIEAGFSGVAFSLWWMPWYFYPYYALLFLAASYHCINGLLVLTARKSGLSSSVKTRAMALTTTVSLGVVLIALMSFGGQLRSNPDPTNNDFATLYETLFGIDLGNGNIRP